MDKKELTKKVVSKLSEKEILSLVGKNINNPVRLVGIFGKEFKEGRDIESVKEIFKAIENSGYINQHNLSVWKKIYDNLGIIYPINVKD